MKPHHDIDPPKWAQRFLAWYCRAELLEDLQGDLYEYFQRNVKSKGLQKARWIYILDVLKFIRSYTIRKPQPATSMSITVYQNYFKTSIRTIARNKLFSTINIVGLAISMSVGLLLIVFMTELKSYDTFHKNYNRMYRVINTYNRPEGGGSEYASTSILAGRRIQQSVSGIEAVAIMRANFDKDLHVGDKTVPVEGFLADEGFFQVFSWEVLGGNTSTALKDLNTVVLTETTAVKLFDTPEVVGKQVLVDTANYTITAVIKDPPKNSHLRFGMVASLTTLDTKRLASKDKNWMSWNQMWQNYVYIVPTEGNSIDNIQRSLDKISEEENKSLDHEKITMSLQPVSEAVLGPDLSNQIGPSVPSAIVWVLGGLAIVVIASACFNYTNLSIARALRRTREVGIRKVVGATKRQVFTQFIVEAAIISLLALGFSFLLFLLIRPGFISLDRALSALVDLKPTATMYLYFLILAISVGVFSGVLPALFFSKINTAQVLKDTGTVRLFRHVQFRKALVIFQYTLSLLLIVSVGIGFRQYQYSVAFDLGFTTENIYNIQLQQNNANVVMHELSALPEVKGISKSMYVSSVGMSWTGNIRYKNPLDSVTYYYNYIDTAYMGLHDLKLLAGKNFVAANYGDADAAGVIINQKTVKWMGLKEPHEAIGEEVFLDGKRVPVIGVVKDFHHNTLNNPLQNFAFRYYGDKVPSTWGGVVNMKIQSDNLPALIGEIEGIWKKIDPIHPMVGMFYEEKISSAYDEMAGMMKVVGFLAFLAISIASLGLLGMVVFTTETRMKEISIRKVLGASEGNLIFLMSRGFMILLSIACAIAIPGAYYAFDQVIFASITYRAPIGFFDLFTGALIVLAVAILAISSQTLRVARVNPSTTLRSE